MADQTQTMKDILALIEKIGETEALVRLQRRGRDFVKVVINRGSGPFVLSRYALSRLKDKDFPLKAYLADPNDCDVRCDPHLTELVEEIGDLASQDEGRYVVIEVPDDVIWHIEDFDHGEYIVEDGQQRESGY